MVHALPPWRLPALATAARAVRRSALNSGNALLLLVAAGCASSPRAMPTAVDAEPCNLSMPAEPEAWLLVRGDGFTFCVPGDWVPARARSSSGIDARVWRTKGASIEWAAEPERLPFRIAPPGSVQSPSTSMPRSSRRFFETIDGREAELWLLDAGGEVRTAVTWTSPRLHISGEARTRELGMLQLDIYRTVRFAER